MAKAETADVVARRRWVTAEALFEGRADLNGYPHQLLGVVSLLGVGLDRMSGTLAGAEMLMSYGWDLVGVTNLTDSNYPCAVMRRR